MKVVRTRGKEHKNLWTVSLTNKDLLAICKNAENKSNVTKMVPKSILNFSVDMRIKDGSCGSVYLYESPVTDFENLPAIITEQKYEVSVKTTELTYKVKFELIGRNSHFVVEYPKSFRGYLTGAFYQFFDHLIKNTIIFATEDGTSLVEKEKAVLLEKINKMTEDKKAKQEAKEVTRAELAEKRKAIREQKMQEVAAKKAASKKTESKIKKSSAEPTVLNDDLGKKAAERAAKKKKDTKTPDHATTV